MHHHQIHLLVACLLGTLALSACRQAEAEPKREPELKHEQVAAATVEADSFPSGPYADRDLELAQQLVEGGALVLDVRSAREYAEGHVAGAVNLPHTQISERIEEILALQGGDRHRPIVLYCRGGNRAGMAKRELEAAGFDRLLNFGGLDDWPGSRE